MPASPVKQHGIRIEPPPSVPSANGVMPAATDAAAPALDPPGVLLRLQGWRVIPVRGLSPTGLHPNSLVVVLPMRMAPAALARSTAGASTAAMLFAIAREPDAYFTPATAIRSLAENGMPCSGPSGRPCMTASSAALAALSAVSGNRTKKAFR